MQPATTNKVVSATPPIGNANYNSRMEFNYGGELYRLRFSYSPDDKIVTRATVEIARVDDGKVVWRPCYYAQVYRKGGKAKDWVEREEDRQAAMYKLLAVDGPYPRQFRALAWAAYWNRGKNTAPASVGVFNG